MKAHGAMREIRRLIRQEVREQLQQEVRFGKITTDSSTNDTVNGVTVTLCKIWLDGDAETTENKVEVVVPVGATVAAGQWWSILFTSRQPRVGVLLRRYA